MGAYLSKPVTEKISKDEQSDALSYGASSMQGWRVSQEDAHNCILDFDTDSSLFAVYDGHGGAEVANYCAMNFPDCLRSMADYKKDNLAQALENAFLEFDASLTKPEVILELKQIAGLPDSDDESVEDARMLREEASLPLDEVLARYETTAISKVAPHVSDYEKPKSPMLRGKKSPAEDVNGLPGCSKSSKLTIEGSSDKDPVPVNGEVDLGDSDTAQKSSEEQGSEKSDLKTSKSVNKKAASRKAAANDDDADGLKPRAVNSQEKKENSSKTGDSDDAECSVSKERGSGDVAETRDSGKGTSKSDVVEPGCSSSGSGRKKRTKAAKGGSSVAQKTSPSDEDDSEEDEDEEYSAEHDSSSEEEVPDSDDDEEGDKDEGSEEDEEDDSEESEEEEDGVCGMMRTNSEEEPGSDSGCTAVVALLRGDQLYVANAGDSRCVVSRDGKAVNMSFDHKPEDKVESDRITKAGGQVTLDGRVNGGLNLSRALGDHAYKDNKDLSLKEQMITALPDLQTLVIDPKEDQFMVLACDGIWNHMSSQEVVDFVNERIDSNDKLSSICEELFDHCLAPDTSGDGTGCDNMTAIIVKFHNVKKQGSKRQSEATTVEETLVNKKLKTEETTE